MEGINMNKTLSLTILIFLLFCSLSAEAGTIRAEASPELAPGYLKRGDDFTIDIYMNNNDGASVLGYSMPFAFYSPDGSITNVIHRDVGGYGDMGSILMVNGFDSYWAILNQWTWIDGDGILADTVNHTTASLSGWPPGLGEQLYIQFAFRIDEEGTFCIDSVSVPNTTPPGKFDWLFDYETPFNGPYCWDVVDEVPQDPEIGVNPTSMDFNAVAGNPSPAPQVLSISNTAAGTLNWTASWNSTWLSMAPAYGTAPSNTQVSVNTTGMSSGIYYDTIVVSDPNATNNPVLVPVTLTLTEPPSVIDLSSDFFYFSAVADDANPPDQYLTVDNSGGGVLNWTASNSESWLSIAPTSGTDFGEITLSVDITGLTYGTYYDTVWVSDPTASNDPQFAEVVLEVVSSLPVLELDPGVIFVAVDADSPVPESKTFEINNSGAGTMNYEVSFDSPRISSITPDAGSAPQTVTIVFDSVLGLVGQTFYDTITVTSIEAVNSPQLIEVQFHIYNDPARILVNKDSVFISLTECGQGIGTFNFPVLTVYNGGGEPFTFAVTNNEDWLTPTPASAPAPQQVQLVVDYSILSPGMYFDTLTISANNAENSPVKVQIVLEVLPTTLTPEIYVDDQYKTFAAQEERLGKAGYLLVDNVNPGCMEWDIDADFSWLSFSIDSSSSNKAYPWDVVMYPNGYGMVMGHYYDTAYVDAPDASNNPYPIIVDTYIWKYYGDVNWDGKVNMLDIVYMINYLYYDGIEPFPERRVGDVNCDYRVDIVDISAMIDSLYRGAGPLCGNPDK